VHSQHSLNARLLRFRSQPHSEDAYALVEDLIEAGRHADARSVIALAKPSDREDGALLLLEGRTHLLERDLIRAQAALLSSVKVDPNHQAAYRYLGEVLLKRGDPLRAQKTLLRALSLNPKDEEARALLERAEYLVEAANDSLEALPSPLDPALEPEADGGSEPELVPEPASEERETQPRAGVTPSPPRARAAGLPEPPRMGSREALDSEPAAPHREARRGEVAPSGRAAPPVPAHLKPPVPAGGSREPRAWVADAMAEEPAASHRERAVPSLRAEAAAPSRRDEASLRAQAPAPAVPSRERPAPAGIPSLDPTLLAAPAAQSAEAPLRAARRHEASKRPEPPSYREGAASAARRSALEIEEASLRAALAGRASTERDDATERASLPEREDAAAKRPSMLERHELFDASLEEPARASEPLRFERAEAAAERGNARVDTSSGELGGEAEREQIEAEVRERASLRAAFDRTDRTSSVPRPPARSSVPPTAPRPTPPPLPASEKPAPRGPRGTRLSDFRMPPGHAQPAAASPAADSGERQAEQALELVRSLGLFEDPSGQPEAWVERAEVEPRGQRVRGALLWLWGVTLLLCAGGYFGWTQFVERRHAAAASLVEQARALLLVGDHAALVDAERMLRLAREQHPASSAVTEEALFVQLARVLEDGERDTAALRSAHARAQASKLSGPSVALGSLLLTAAGADREARDRALADVVAQVQGDARSLYLLGRAEERMGLDAALAHLEAAARAEPKLVPAQLALAERAYEHGERSVAARTLDTALTVAPAQLRVRLFHLLVLAEDLEPDKLRQELNGLATPLRKGNSIDQALAALVRARLARRSAETAGAHKALEAAAASGVEEPRVLGLLAEEALAVGESGQAQLLASRALSLAPERARSRRLLARVLLERGAGQQAYALLSSLPADDAELQLWRARAALLSGDPELLRSALAALPPASKPEPDVQRAALRLRIETQLEPSRAVLDRARGLARAAPTDPDALLALAEAALAMRDSKLAQNALKQRAVLLPDDAQAQTLLGRSLRMSGDAEGSEAAFRRALVLRPGYVEAQAALASLLLDRGQFAAADTLYRELALRDETALSGRLGRVEALLGQGKLADAQVQLEAAPEAERATAAYRDVAAKLALAKGELAVALKLLGALAEEQPKRANVRALYAEALSAASQLPAATAQLDAALGLDPGLPEALLGRAELQLRANKVKDALATLAKAEAALKERVRPPAQAARRLVLLGRAYLQRKKRGDAPSAVRALRDAAGMTGAAADAFFFLGEALTLDKDKPGALAAYRRYLELAPNGVYRQRAQRMLGAAR
jgi:tetratricopeptide (TPR) repeat protein